MRREQKKPKLIVFLLFGTGTVFTRKLSRYSGQAWKTPKKIPAVWEREFKAFLLRNIWEQEIPLMPDLWFGQLHYKVLRCHTMLFSIYHFP